MISFNSLTAQFELAMPPVNVLSIFALGTNYGTVSLLSKKEICSEKKIFLHYYPYEV